MNGLLQKFNSLMLIDVRESLGRSHKFQLHIAISELEYWNLTGIFPLLVVPRVRWRPGWWPWRPVAARGGPGGPGGPLGGPGGPGGPLGGLWRPWRPAWRPLAALAAHLAARWRPWRPAAARGSLLRLRSESGTLVTTRQRCWRPAGGPLAAPGGPGGPLAARLAALAARWRPAWRPWRPASGPLGGPGGPAWAFGGPGGPGGPRWRPWRPLGGLPGGPGGLWRPARGGPGGPGGPGGLLAALSTLLNGPSRDDLPLLRRRSGFGCPRDHGGSNGCPTEEIAFIVVYHGGGRPPSGGRQACSEKESWEAAATR
eukprot:gene16633-biopygen1650